MTPSHGGSRRRIHVLSTLENYRGAFLVTGANGFVGRNTCAVLARHGHNVLGLVRSSSGELDAMGVETIVGDLRDSRAWADRLEEVEYVVHCAGNARFGNRGDYEGDNVQSTATLLGTVRERARRLRRFVLVSTIGVLDRARTDDCSVPLDESSVFAPSSEYGRSKVKAEALVISAGLPYSIVRPALVVGDEMRQDSHFAVFARWAAQRRLPARIRWTGAFSVVAVEDLAEALRIVAVHPDALGKTFVCAGERVELATFLATSGVARLPAKLLAAIARRARFLVPFSLKSMLLPALVADDSALRKLGWHSNDVTGVLASVVRREEARIDPNVDPPSGQTVITGAASGLGRAFVEHLARCRSRVLLVDRDADGLAQLRNKYPHVRTEVVDLADEAALGRLLASDAWKHAPVVEFFASAGLGRRGEFSRDAIAAQLDMLRVNLLARVRMSHAAALDMRRLQFGRIVLVSSSSAFQPLPFMSTYAASNVALLYFGEGLAHELSGQGIHVLTICPGGMQTNFQARARVRANPREQLLSPERVVQATMMALARRDTTLLISARTRLMALAARAMPRRLSLRLWGNLMAAMR